jgi:hypothetical protein
MLRRNEPIYVWRGIKPAFHTGVACQAGASPDRDLADLPGILVVYFDKPQHKLRISFCLPEQEK